MKVCFFGNYHVGYPRNQVLLAGLKKNKISALECRTRDTGLKKYWSLFMRHRRMVGSYDVMIVAFSGFSVMWFARLITRKPIVFDAFVSLYLTNVEDRKTCRPKSPRAFYYAFLDWFSCWLASAVLLDTQAQVNYFVRHYRLPAGKFTRIFVGADDTVYFPATSHKPQATRFFVHWHGHIVPFHGLETVIDAARILRAQQDIRFQIVTRFGSKYRAAQAAVERLGLSNIEFIPEQPAEKLAQLINKTDVCLGVFGNNAKAGVVIPNKIFEAAACAKPVITAAHEVVRELFTDNQNILLVPPKDPKALAGAIMRLKTDNHIRNLLGQRAYELYQARLTPAVLGLELQHVLFPRNAKT